MCFYIQSRIPKKTEYKQTQVSQTIKNLNYYIPFTGYYGDSQPVKKLYWVTSNNNLPKHDDWTDNHIYEYGYKKIF